MRAQLPRCLALGQLVKNVTGSLIPALSAIVTWPHAAPLVAHVRIEAHLDEAGKGIIGCGFVGRQAETPGHAIPLISPSQAPHHCPGFNLCAAACPNTAA